MLKIAVPNKGSLSEGAMQLIREAGYKCRRNGKELVCVDSANNIEFVFIRPKDIATYVDSGVFSFGITGRDIVADTPSCDLTELLGLNFGKASMRYIIPGLDEFTGLEQFEGKRIACSYPNLVKAHLAENNINASVVKLDGAVEISIHLGIADAAADVVETGTTIKQAGLKVVGDVILKSEAILVSKSDDVTAIPEAATFLKRLQGVVTARQYVMVEFDVPADKVSEACAICPGIESPTVTNLQDENWKSVKSLVKSKEMNNVMDELSDLGAKGIISSAIKTLRI